MTQITIADLRACGICPDARKWCDKHGIDWRDFVTNGVDVETLRSTGDNLSVVDRLENAAKERAGHG